MRPFLCMNSTHCNCVYHCWPYFSTGQDYQGKAAFFVQFVRWHILLHKKNILVVDQLPTRKREYMTTVDQAMVKILIPGGGGRRVAKPGPGWQSPPGGPSHGARWARRRAGEGPFCLINSLISLSLAVIWGANVDNLYLQVDYLAARTVGRRGNGECEKAYNCPGFLMILFRFLTLIFFGFLEQDICQHWSFLFVQLQQTHLPTWLRWWKIFILSFWISLLLKVMSLHVIKSDERFPFAFMSKVMKEQVSKAMISTPWIWDKAYILNYYLMVPPKKVFLTSSFILKVVSVDVSNC